MKAYCKPKRAPRSYWFTASPDAIRNIAAAKIANLPELGRELEAERMCVRPRKAIIDALAARVAELRSRERLLATITVPCPVRFTIDAARRFIDAADSWFLLNGANGNRSARAVEKADAEQWLNSLPKGALVKIYSSFDTVWFGRPEDCRSEQKEAR